MLYENAFLELELFHFVFLFFAFCVGKYTVSEMVVNDLDKPLWFKLIKHKTIKYF